MASAHGPIFCRKELREKSRSEGPIFSRTESAQTTDFLLQAAPRKNRTDFFSDQKSELLCVTIAGEVSLLDDVTSIFYRTEVSAHGPIFSRKQLREKIGAILYRSKSQRTRTDFHTDFLSRIKNRSVCAGHYCCIYHNTSNGDKIVMKCIAFLMFILYIFSQEIYGDNGRMYQIMIYKKMVTPNYGCVGATDKFTCSDTVSVLYLSCFSFS